MRFVGAVIFVVVVLSESKNPRKYWGVLKSRLNSEGVELATISSQLKLPPRVSYVACVFFSLTVD